MPASGDRHSPPPTTVANAARPPCRQRDGRKGGPPAFPLGACPLGASGSLLLQSLGSVSGMRRHSPSPPPLPRRCLRPPDCLYGRRLGESDGSEASRLVVQLVALARSGLLVVCCWVHVAGFVLLGSRRSACWSLWGGACPFRPCLDAFGRARRCSAVAGRPSRA